MSAATYVLLVIVCGPVASAGEGYGAAFRYHGEECRLYQPPWLVDLPFQECRDRKKEMAAAVIGPGVRWECEPEDKN